MKNPFNRKAQKIFIEAWRHLTKGMELLDKAILKQALGKRKNDTK